MGPLLTSEFPYDIVLDIMADILEIVSEEVYSKPEIYLEKITVGQNKPALKIDVYAEDLFRKSVEFKAIDVEVFGEERPDPDLDLSEKKSLCALVDMVDGTDLLERGLHNWCSSAVFFNPSLLEGQKIVGAFISVPPGNVYFALKDIDGAFLFRRLDEGSSSMRERITNVAGCSETKTLSDASICFYGQKSSRLGNKAYQKLIKYIMDFGDLRVYNLAGMPMIVKLIDKQVKKASGIDAVFDFVGQNPHDVVPGAYLAMKAGATVINLDSDREMTDLDLEKALMKPFNEESQLRYIIGATHELTGEIKSLFGKSDAAGIGSGE